MDMNYTYARGRIVYTLTNAEFRTFVGFIRSIEIRANDFSVVERMLAFVRDKTPNIWNEPKIELDISLIMSYAVGSLIIDEGNPSDYLLQSMADDFCRIARTVQLIN